MTTEAMPAMPALTGNPFTDSQARQEHTAALVQFFDKNPTQDVNAFLRSRSAPPPAPPKGPTPDEQTARIQNFDADMRNAGIQRSDVVTGEVDQAAHAELMRRRQEAGANPGVEFLRVWEKDAADVFAGRRLGENQQAWEARKAGVALAPAADGATYVEPSALKPEQLHGYTLLTVPDGYTVDPAEASAQLAAARAAGMTQQMIDAYVSNLLAGVTSRA